MYKCVKVRVQCRAECSHAVRQGIEQHARSLDIEGVLHARGDAVLEILVAGTKEQIDAFIDRLVQFKHESQIEGFEVEAALKERDFRGVFRVIE